MQDALDDLLSEWHKWASGYTQVASIGTNPMFRDAKSSRGWDAIGDIVDETIDSARLETVNFCVFELQPDYRTVIQLHARNLAMGTSDWVSPRIPIGVIERTELLCKAKDLLSKRLFQSGVI